MTDKIEAQLHALKSFGITKEKYVAMLFPQVESCLPAEILRAWERYVGYSSDESAIAVDRLLSLFVSFNASLLQGRLPVSFEQAITQGYSIFFPPRRIHMINISLEPKQEDNGRRG
ncbi:hypothetical protein TNCV_3484681 [Trichonephila clavipes]|nr:hypothetical protein TNCV_3484681 [Trichonephila clavipes]